MNFLGHLYLSGDNFPLMVANLFGDFVKGKDYTHLPKIVQQGVYLHRQIDSFTDQHQELSKVKKVLYPTLPKITPVAIDLYLDHLLAKNWSSYHPQDLEVFSEHFFDFFFSPKRNIFNEETDFVYPPQFVELIAIMQQRDWLNRYRNLEGLDMACSGLSKRISFPNVLYKGKSVFIEHETLITDAFRKFMKDAQTISGSN